MPLAKIPFKNVEPLLRKHLSKQEDLETKALMKKFSGAKQRGYLRKSELIDVCYWKSARAINLIKLNSPSEIRKLTEQAFATRFEKKKLELLTTLSGVDIPMASSILTLIDPKNYGVIDIRAWQVLFEMGTVNTNPKGVNFSFKEWYRYLQIIRYFAKKFKATARDIERTLYEAHQHYQKGKLYEH